MNPEALNFLESLCNSFGPSGFEREPVALTKAYVSSFADSIKQDKLGSLLFSHKGTADSPTILLPGHADEVGFVVSGINDKGYLTFNAVGGWFDQVLLGQRVRIRTQKGDVQGIIASKPPHILPPEERSKVVERAKMFIDVGCSNRHEAQELGISTGDPVVPVSVFSTMTKRSFDVVNGQARKKGMTQVAIGKAFDDRIGVFMAAEVVRRLATEGIKHPNNVVGAATTQEEVGCRGAKTVAWLSEPDVCLTLEVDIAGDVPGIESHDAPALLGKGPSIVTFDASMVPNQPLKELVIATAKKKKIPYQLSQIARGGTDAGSVHLVRAGCPSLVIGVPTRHIHSHAGILNLDDVEHCIQLVIEVVKLLDRKRVDGLTAI